MAEKFLGYNRGLYSGPSTVEGDISEADRIAGYRELSQLDRELSEAELSLMEKGGQAIDKWDKYIVDIATLEADLQKARLTAIAQGQDAAAKTFGDKISLLKEYKTEARGNGDSYKAFQAMVAPHLETVTAKFIGTVDQVGGAVGTGELEKMTPEEFERDVVPALNEAMLGVAQEVMASNTLEGATKAGSAMAALDAANESMLTTFEIIAKRNPDLLPQIEVQKANWKRQLDRTGSSDMREAWQADKTRWDARSKQFLDMNVAGISPATAERLAKGVDAPDYGGFSWDRAAQSEQVQRMQTDIQQQRASLQEQRTMLDEAAESTMDPMSRTIRQYERAFGANFDAYVAAMNFKGSDRERKQRAIMHFVDKPDQFNRFVAVAESTPTANVDTMRAALEQQGVTTSRFARGLVGATRRTPATPSPPTAASKVDGADSPGPTAGPSTQDIEIKSVAGEIGLEAAPADDLAHRTGPNGGGKGSIYTEQAARYKQRGTDLKAKQQELLAQLARKRDTEVA